jgi:hypothetical protein
MSAELQVKATDEYSSIVEEKLADLLPKLKEGNVNLPPVQSLRTDPVTMGTAAIIVSIVGSVGPVLVREIFKTIREIVRDSRKDNRAHRKPARAVIRHRGKDHVLVTGDENFEGC